MRQTFPKSERLTSKKLIGRLFDRNASRPDAPLSVYAFPFRVMYVLAATDSPEPLTDVPASSPTAPQVLFSVPKRAFKKAVERNQIRRRCREAYRLNKRILQQAAGAYPTAMPAAITFLYTAKTEISFDDIEKGMKLALKRVQSSLAVQGSSQ